MAQIKSVLETPYAAPTRLYSQLELLNNRYTLYRKLRLSDTRAYHNRCKHFYLTRLNGKKEKIIKDKGINTDVGNCSVCWKIRRTPKNLKNTAMDTVEGYMQEMYDPPNLLRHEHIDLENVFYTWLYNEFNEE